MKKTPQKIVFYDGDCGFCNRVVQFVLSYQKDGSIYFSSIQSEYATDLFRAKKWQIPDLSTFYFFEDGKLRTKSDAAIRLTKYLKFPLSIIQLFWILPQYPRDIVYDFVAKRRKRWSKEFCVLPKKEDKHRFLE